MKKQIIKYFFSNFVRLQHKSAILNDDSGTGKLFQCVAFFDAVLKTKTPAHILVICQNKQSLDLWHYCIDTLLENVPVVIADFEPHFDQSTSTMKRITLVSSSYALIHLDQLKTIRYDYLVIQDQHLQLSTASLERLKEIQASHKLILCSINLFVGFDHLCFCLKPFLFLWWPWPFLITNFLSFEFPGKSIIFLRNFEIFK